MVREYVRRLSDEELKFVGVRLSHRLGGDVGEAIESIQRNPDMDRSLAVAGTANEFFNMIDQLDYGFQQEMKRRFGNYQHK